MENEAEAWEEVVDDPEYAARYPTREAAQEAGSGDFNISASLEAVEPPARSVRYSWVQVLLDRLHRPNITALSAELNVAVSNA